MNRFVRAAGHIDRDTKHPFAGIFVEIVWATVRPTPRIPVSSRATQPVKLQLLRETGATGLEPATSGVTGRYELNRHSRLRPGITGWSRHFVQSRTGCDRLRPAATR